MGQRSPPRSRPLTLLYCRDDVTYRCFLLWDSGFAGVTAWALRLRPGAAFAVLDGAQRGGQDGCRCANMALRRAWFCSARLRCAARATPATGVLARCMTRLHPRRRRAWVAARAGAPCCRYAAGARFGFCHSTPYATFREQHGVCRQRNALPYTAVGFMAA
jgi:hypothetical protein